MSTFYSLRFKPNWDPSYNPSWRDVTATLDVDQLPSISIAAERGDVSLVAAASDLSLTVVNADGIWDLLFDANRIIGQLPPVNGEVLRAPAAHYGEIMLCRYSTNVSLWQVMFAGFVDPRSPQFDRNNRSCSFTAYSASKLLEIGNAERVHRFFRLVEARPFVVPVDAADLNHGAIQHPTSAAGIFYDSDGNALPPDNSWWRIVRGAVSPVIPIEANDQFKVVRAVAVGGWTEGMETISIVDKTFTVARVASSGGDLYVQTTEAVDDALLVLGGFTASIELLTPWYRGRDWKALIDGSDGNTNCLAKEANSAIALLLGLPDTTETIDFFGSSSDLTLLPVSRQLFAQPIFEEDAAPGCLGVAYGLYSGTPFLAHQRLGAGGDSPVGAKPDILAPDSVGAPFASFPRCSSAVYSHGATAGYFKGPDDDQPVQLISSSINDQLTSPIPPDYATDDLPVAGQSIHRFNIPTRDFGGVVGIVSEGQVFESTHWCRTPSSYRSGGEPKRLYRIIAWGRYVNAGKVLPGHFRKGISITELTTGDEGATWTIVSTAADMNNYEDDIAATANSSQSSRPSIKVFELGASSFLYVWVDPIKSAAYCYESAADNVAATALVGTTAFIVGDDVGSPILSSSAVHWPGATIFMADRADRTGVDFWFYSAGPTWTKGVFVDETGRGLASNLMGADWINAITDFSRNPTRLYVMVGRTLYAMQVQVTNPGTPEFRVIDWQAVTLDTINYDANVEAVSLVASNPNAVAWLAGPVVQAFSGEPDYTGSSDALIVATQSAIYIVSNTASNIVDVADFGEMSVAAAISKLVILRAYFVLAGPDKDFVTDPDAYTPVHNVNFYARLETSARKGVLDLTALTEAISAGTWLQNYQSVQVQNSKLKVGPAYSKATLSDLDGSSYTVVAPRNAASSALDLDIPFITTVSFAELLANMYAAEFVVPRMGASIVVKSPYAQGFGKNILPGLLVRYLLVPPDSVNRETERVGRVLTIDYGLDVALDTLTVA